MITVITPFDIFCDVGMHNWCVTDDRTRYVCPDCGLGVRVLRMKPRPFIIDTASVLRLAIPDQF